MTQPSPRLLRRKVLADAADPDWAATQVSPGDLLTVVDPSVGRVLIVPVARDGGGAVVAGTCTLQLVAEAAIKQTLVSLVWAAPAEAGGATGDALEYDVTTTPAFTIRVVDSSLLVGAATLDLYWLPIGG